MQHIKLNKGAVIELPEDWTEIRDLTVRLRAFERLSQMLQGGMTPFEWQLQTLFDLTGYKPSRRTRRALKQGRPVEEIAYNLIRLAELLDFAFSIEEKESGGQIIRLNYAMNDCPFPALPGWKGKETYTPPVFWRSYTIQTNLKAGQYAEATELLLAASEENIGEEERLHYLRRMMCVLYQTETMPDTVPYAVMLAVSIWLTGIMQFWQHHPDYSVLYETTRTNGAEETNISDDHISLGLREVILELQERGHRDAKEMLLPDFFDAQVKMLRDKLQEAKAQGVKLPDLVQKTGIPLHNVNRLL